MALMRETNNWNVTIQDVIKINAADGDTLLVSLPEQSTSLSPNELDDMFKRVAQAFEQTLAGKDVKVIVVSSGTKVELIKSSKLADK